MVYNEWAAVIQHQDEMDRALKESEQKRNKGLQQMYKKELDNQRAQIYQKQLESKYQDKQLGQSMLDY
jgi:trehalose-6-phosphate synthase